jgi:hypothetical protein
MKKPGNLGLVILGSLFLAAPGARAALPDVPIEEPPPAAAGLEVKPSPPAPGQAPKKRRARPTRRAPGRERSPRKPDLEADTQAQRRAPEIETRSQ